jgi:hypothetical protein
MFSPLFAKRPSVEIFRKFPDVAEAFLKALNRPGEDRRINPCLSGLFARCRPAEL